MLHLFLADHRAGEGWNPERPQVAGEHVRQAETAAGPAEAGVLSGYG